MLFRKDSIISRFFSESSGEDEFYRAQAERIRQETKNRQLAALSVFDNRHGQPEPQIPASFYYARHPMSPISGTN